MKLARLKIYHILILSILLMASIVLVACNDNSNKNSDNGETSPPSTQVQLYGNWILTPTEQLPSYEAQKQIKIDARFSHDNYVMLTVIDENQTYEQQALPYSIIDSTTAFIVTTTIDDEIIKDGDILDIYVQPNNIFKINSNNELEFILQTNNYESKEELEQNGSFTYKEAIVAVGTRSGDYQTTGKEPNIQNNFATGQFERKNEDSTNSVILNFDNNTLKMNEYDKNKDHNFGINLAFFIHKDDDGKTYFYSAISGNGAIEYNQENDSIILEGATFIRI
ncbi:MAG: hypothetical protein FWF56_06565 [Firmicutes bacterium]|nr:hypothetical protein [Bacillota bacterium]MCL1953591.1 hypothetical protein [Bacillota bacterium]